MSIFQKSNSHIFTRPFPWGEKLTDSIILENKKIHFLLATISDTASDFSAQKGYSIRRTLY